MAIILKEISNIKILVNPVKKLLKVTCSQNISFNVNFSNNLKAFKS
jgi:hypothetical protein